NKRCNTTITIAQLYEFDTIASLSSLIEKGSTGSAGKEKAENEIAERIAQLKQQVLESMPDKDNVEDVYPMRDIQKGMVLLSSINQAAGMYHDQFVYHVQSIRLEAFEQALSILVKQHPALRTSFDLTAFDEEVQIVHKTIDFKIKRKDIQHLTVREQEAFINGFMVEERKIPFDTRTAPLWRVDLFRISAETEVLLFQFHHAILDGWSVAALHTELFRIYHELSADAAYSPAPLKASDKQAVIEELLEKNNQDNIQFWKDELKDYQRVAIFSNNPVYKTFTNIYVPAFKQELLEKCREDGISVKSLTYGALVYVMKVLSNESDFIIGSVSNNRPVIEDGDRLLGCFLNTTPVRNKLEGMDDLSWRKYFRRIDEQLNGLKRRERTTLYEIVKHSGEKEMEGSPFFDVLYNYIDFHIYNEMFFRGDDRPGKSTGQQLAVPIFESTNTALGLTVNVSGNAFVLTYTLNRELKVDITLERIHECVDHILSAYLHSPDLQLKETGLVAEAEKQKLLYTLNDTRRDYPENETFLDMFEKQVNQSPQATALVFEGAELSYKALDEQSNRLAHYLLAQGVQKGELVPVYLERSSEMIISILAILKAGAAYLPIDTGNPVERVNFMLDDSGARFVLSLTLFTAFFDVQKITPIFVDDLQYQDLPVLKTAVQLKGEDLTYVIYTSGSTGKPKGVLISHSSLASRLHFYKRYYELSQADNILFYRSFSFDGAIEEYLLPFAIGAKCIIAGPAFKDHLFNNIIEHIERFKISKVNMPPILLQDVIEALPADQIHRISSLRHIVSGGDKLNEEVVSNFYWKTGDLVQATLYNSYGPTENTIDSTILKLDRNVKVVSIGKPIDNTAVYILDKHNRLLPFGMTGEICVSGAGLAKGYLKREALTAEKFIPNPFREGERLYKTGDLGRWLPDGNIAFIGRIDNQVKIRGHRIELGEIESSILQSGYVENAAVLVKTSADMRKYLLAYVITKEGYQRELLYGYLKNHLPAYMLPGMVIEVAAFPLTTNGKLNLEALPEPEEQHTITESYVEPGNETETQLVEIWKQLLNLKQIGVRDNFFQLGGDSLTVVKLQHRLQTTFGTPVSIVDLFNNTSVEKQALLLQKDLKMKEEEKPAEALKF
ncbi:MAG TPA: amino acid adenylation domain-containing protein, partial [Chitinophaga sp.]